MSGFIEEFYYGNIEPQESNNEFKAVLKKKLDSLTETEKELSEKIPNEKQEFSASLSDIVIPMNSIFVILLRMNTKMKIMTNTATKPSIKHQARRQKPTGLFV